MKFNLLKGTPKKSIDQSLKTLTKEKEKNGDFPDNTLFLINKLLERKDIMDTENDKIDGIRMLYRFLTAEKSENYSISQLAKRLKS